MHIVMGIPIWVQVLEDQAEHQALYTTQRHDVRCEAVAEIEQLELERERCIARRRRKASNESRRRDREAILKELRKVDGIELRECACGCETMFEVEHGPGRPQQYATVQCKCRAVMRLVRGRIFAKKQADEE